MTDTLIRARQFWSGGSLKQNVCLRIENGLIAGIADAFAEGRPPEREIALVTVPFSDLQVNGGGGVMVNADPSPEGLHRIARAHQALGVGDILPTVISDTPEVMEAAVDAALAVAGTTGVLGLHLEGPHFSMARRGTHAARFIRPLDRRTVDIAGRLRAAGIPVMVTLAPEQADPGLLAALVESGAVVSAGHSSATASEARAGFAAGITCVTHLFNAMDQMSSRAPGLLGAAINAPVACGVICDGIHVSWDMLRIALRARPAPGLSFAVSDAMATVGGPDHFELYGQTISVQDGRLVNAEGALAGAHIDLVQSFANLRRHLGLPLEEALAMVSDIPRRVLGLAPREIAAGTPLTEVLMLDQANRPVTL